MNIDFTGQIREMKERDILHKPFPCFEGYALFTKNQKGQYIKLTFSNQESIKAYLNELGYDWGNEPKNEFTNFDCENRLCTVLPELKEAEVVAADPQWDPEKAPVEIKTRHESTRTMEDIPHCAVELREVDHQVTPVSDHPAHNESLKASAKDYSDLYNRVSGEYSGPLKVGDHVKNVNPKCTHYKSEGVVKKFNKIDDDKGVTVAYECTNAGKSWKEGDVLDKTPDQLEKKG